VGIHDLQVDGIRTHIQDPEAHGWNLHGKLVP